MEVDVENRLAGLGIDIENGSISSLVDAELFRQIFGHVEHPAEYGMILRG